MDEEVARQQAIIKVQEIKILQQEFFTFVHKNNDDIDHLAIFTLLQSQLSRSTNHIRPSAGSAREGVGAGTEHLKIVGKVNHRNL